MANKVEHWACEEHHRVAFWCPGCEQMHALPIDGDASKHPVWQWNGDRERPTLSPSILSRWTGKESGEHRCHSFVRDGKIEFLSDCTHQLAGQTVELEDVKE